EGMHDRARIGSRKQPVGGEGDYAEAGRRILERVGEHAVEVGPDVEVVHRTREIEIRVGVETLHEGDALVAQIALDLEVGIERESRIVAVLEPTTKFAVQRRKFGRRFQDRDNPTFSFDADFQVESYLRHQGITFVERFDANSYLCLTRAMDYFDLAADYEGVVANAFRGAPTR